MRVSWQRSSWKKQVVLVTFLLSALRAPMSWRKAQLGDSITWCGWTFHLDIDCLHLAQAKLAKLRTQLKKLAGSKKIQRKFLESSLGLLMWAISTCPLRRPYLAPLYKDLRSSRGTLLQIHARDWRRFRDSLSPYAVVTAQVLGMWISAKSKLLAVGAITINSKQDVPAVPPARKPQWVRLSDPSRSEVHLRNESRQALRWLASGFSHDQLRAMRQAPLLPCMAAADAVAEGETIGIGGWISTSKQSFGFPRPGP